MGAVLKPTGLFQCLAEAKSMGGDGWPGVENAFKYCCLRVILCHWAAQHWTCSLSYHKGIGLIRDLTEICFSTPVLCLARYPFFFFWCQPAQETVSFGTYWDNQSNRPVFHKCNSCLRDSCFMATSSCDLNTSLTDSKLGRAQTDMFALLAVSREPCLSAVPI